MGVRDLGRGAQDSLWFPAPTWLLATVCNSVPEDLTFTGTAHRWYTKRCKQNTHTHKKKIFKSEEREGPQPRCLHSAQTVLGYPAPVSRSVWVALVAQTAWNTGWAGWRRVGRGEPALPPGVSWVRSLALCAGALSYRSKQIWTLRVHVRSGTGSQSYCVTYTGLQFMILLPQPHNSSL